MSKDLLITAGQVGISFSDVDCPRRSECYPLRMEFPIKNPVITHKNAPAKTEA